MVTAFRPASTGKSRQDCLKRPGGFALHMLRRKGAVQQGFKVPPVQGFAKKYKIGFSVSFDHLIASLNFIPFTLISSSNFSKFLIFFL
jgi:hypothetical protein